jgi:hypothetical protein
MKLHTYGTYRVYQKLITSTMVHDNGIKIVNMHSSSMDHTSNNKEIKSPSFISYTTIHIKDTTIAPSTHRDKLKHSLLL